MTAISLLERPRHTDHLRLRDGGTLTVRFIDADEGEALQGYFRKLSVGSRHSRFLGAMSELPPGELDHFLHVGENNRFSLLGTVMTDGRETIVGEARYGFEAETGRFEIGIPSTTFGRAMASARHCLEISSAGRLRSVRM